MGGHAGPGIRNPAHSSLDLLPRRTGGRDPGDRSFKPFIGQKPVARSAFRQPPPRSPGAIRLGRLRSSLARRSNPEYYLKERVTRLEKEGYPARATLSKGDAAVEILDSSRTHPADRAARQRLSGSALRT